MDKWLIAVIVLAAVAFVVIVVVVPTVIVEQNKKRRRGLGFRGFRARNAALPWCTWTEYALAWDNHGVRGPFSNWSRAVRSFQDSEPEFSVPAPDQPQWTPVVARRVNLGEFEDFPALDWTSATTFVDHNNPCTEVPIPEQPQPPAFVDWTARLPEADKVWCVLTQYHVALEHDGLRGPFSVWSEPAIGSDVGTDPLFTLPPKPETWTYVVERRDALGVVTSVEVGDDGTFVDRDNPCTESPVPTQPDPPHFKDWERSQPVAATTLVPPQPSFGTGVGYARDNGYTWTAEAEGGFPVGKRYRYRFVRPGLAGPWSLWTAPQGSEATGYFARSTRYTNPAVYGSRPTRPDLTAQWQAWTEGEPQPQGQTDTWLLVVGADCENAFVDQGQRDELTEPRVPMQLEPSAPTTAAMPGVTRTADGATFVEAAGRWAPLTLYRYQLNGAWSAWSRNFYAEANATNPVFCVPMGAEAVQRNVGWVIMLGPEGVAVPTSIGVVIGTVHQRLPSEQFELGWANADCDILMVFRGSLAVYAQAVSIASTQMQALGFTTGRSSFDLPGNTVVADRAPTFRLENIPFVEFDRVGAVTTLVDTRAPASLQRAPEAAHQPVGGQRAPRPSGRPPIPPPSLAARMGAVR